MIDITKAFGVSTAAIDNSAAINQALATLGPQGVAAFLPPGIYPIKNPIIIGNGSASAQSTWTATLIGGGSPNWTWMPSANSPVSTALLWTGAGGMANGMINIMGPLSGGGISNLLLDGGSTPANAPALALKIISGQLGVYERVAMQNCYGGLTMTTQPIGGLTAQCNSMHNQFRQLMGTIVPFAATAGAIVNFTSADNTANSCFNNFINTMLVIPTSSLGGTQIGVQFQACDSIVFRDLHFCTNPGGSDTKFWVRFNYNGPSNNWPSDCLIDQIDFGTNNANCVTTTGTPLSLTGNFNRIMNIGPENGVPSWASVNANPHLSINTVNAASGQATLVAGTVTVADSRITAGQRIRLTNMSPGGTVGALSGTTSAGQLVINSTNAADTSIVHWEAAYLP